MEPSASPQRSSQQGGRIMLTQAEKGQTFRALHQRGDAFIIPNRGTLARHGFWRTSALRRCNYQRWVCRFSRAARLCDRPRRDDSPRRGHGGRYFAACQR